MSRELSWKAAFFVVLTLNVLIIVAFAGYWKQAGSRLAASAAEVRDAIDEKAEYQAWSHFWKAKYRIAAGEREQGEYELRHAMHELAKATLPHYQQAVSTSTLSQAIHHTPPTN